MRLPVAANLCSGPFAEQRAIKHKVMIMKCDRYDPAKIAMIVSKGMEELGVVPHGRVLIKPNCGLAHPVLFAHSYSRAEFLEGVILAIKERGKAIEEVAVGENSGSTIPTRFCFRHAGYGDVLTRHSIKAYYFDETKQVPVRLEGEQCLRNSLFVPREIVECDFFVNLPKFKAHPWTRMSIGLKNYMGIQNDENRLLDHNAFLEHKIADLQHVIQPGFIAVDAIIAGQKMVMDPSPFPLGAIVMGTNSCAVDAVCCHIVRVNPMDVIHLRLTAERGFGPIDLRHIEVAGDYPLEEIRQRTNDFELVKERIDDYFKDHPRVRCTVGTFPEEHAGDYCWGGCAGLLLEAMHLHEKHSPKRVEAMAKIHYVVGMVDGPFDVAPDEKVIFAGDCCAWEGSLNGVRVKIAGDYKPGPDGKGGVQEGRDLFWTWLHARGQCLMKASSNYVHIKGCPVSGTELGTYLAFFARLPHVPFDARTMTSLMYSYLRMRLGRLSAVHLE